jgi:hypothetical protein
MQRNDGTRTPCWFRRFTRLQAFTQSGEAGFGTAASHRRFDRQTNHSSGNYRPRPDISEPGLLRELDRHFSTTEAFTQSGEAGFTAVQGKQEIPRFPRAADWFQIIASTDEREFLPTGHVGAGHGV